MNLPDSNEAQVTFHDASDYFSEDEWKLLHEWQKELYRNVMTEIHQALISLGPIIANTVRTIRAKERKELYIMDKQRKSHSPNSQNVSCDVLLRINKEEPHIQGGQIPERCADTTYPSSCPPVVTSVFPLRTKDGDTNDQESKDERNSVDHSTSFHSPGGCKNTRSTEEEPEGCPMVYAYQHQGERSTVPCSETTVNTPRLSVSIKEEGETLLLDPKMPDRRDSINTPVVIQSESTNKYWKWSIEKCTEKGTSKNMLHRRNDGIPFQYPDRGETSKRETCPQQKQPNNVSNRQDKDTLCRKDTWTECWKNCVEGFDHVVHQRKHKGEKNYRCNECGKSFSERTTLIYHQKEHAEAQKDQTYSCGWCGKTFISSSNLISHERTHTGEKPYTCAQCGKSFIQKYTLISHQRTHTGEKPYQCSECGKRFSDISSRNRHRILHTGEKPFKCSQCGKRFSDRSNHLRHQRNHAQEKDTNNPENNTYK
ncbi:zinc finger protein 514-like isoform X2 [Ambystoma mexicanum]|uniref:zinc finger protein 514-like isoform X2 n=2 Tax=Ambystoma mexicanum TaxID=8296 RepID=UPI0037E8C004